MGLFDIFSTSFLITIAITMLALCLMFLYFSQKLSEQDHKISSMVDLVTTMAQEIHLLKNTSHTSEVHYPSDLTNNVAPTLVTKHNELIEVSDDDESLDSNASLDSASLEDELDDSELDDESLASLEESELNDINSLNKLLSSPKTSHRPIYLIVKNAEFKNISTKLIRINRILRKTDKYIFLKLA